MRGFLIRFVVSFLALGFTTAIVRGIDLEGANAFQEFLSLGAAALVLGALNAVVRPVLIVLTLPVTILTLGLSIVALNGFLLWLTSKVVEGFHVRTFWAALLGTLLMSVISAMLNGFVRDRRERTTRMREI
jgi:putative membrane protein